MQIHLQDKTIGRGQRHIPVRRLQGRYRHLGLRGLHAVEHDRRRIED